MSHTPFCWLMDQTHDGLFALVGRSDDCPICGAEAVAHGYPHVVGCERAKSASAGAETPLSAQDAALIKKPADIALYVGGLSAIFVTAVLVKFSFDAMGKGRAPPMETLPPPRGY